MRSLCRPCLLLALAVCLALPAGAFAQGGAIEQKQGELEQVQSRIRALESEIASTRASHGKETEAMAEAERAVSAARRKLRSLRQQRSATERELAAAESARAEVTQRIEARREELASLLRRHYMHGGSDVAPFLSGGDPNQIARDAHYLEHLGRARLELLDGLRADLREQERLAAEAAQRRDRLVELETAQRQEQAQLEKVLARRAAVVAELSGQLRGQEGEIGALREDRQQLARVIDLLKMQAAQRAKPRPQSAPVTRIDTGPLAEAAPAAPFGSLRGRLGFPVQGELAARFGAQRDDGGTRWRGLFIRANDGDEVRAVAAGEVVFSDWLRGYGNLIIVDHGDDYLTIYGYNDAVLRVVGERVAGGEAIAYVGASGGVPESGLYFELRHKGEPVDPLGWMRRR
ncbi:MAG: peptidoglycan DD-metalloendopeptidase family protein [Pseudazoarcus pumilus]|nr:peptidoglycan DD-metalloendopeptidase family protein [Pseudazoarcus pumilus]